MQKARIAPVLFVRGVRDGGALMISRVSGALVHMTSLPYISKDLVTTLATIRHPNLAPIYTIQLENKGPSRIFSGYTLQPSLKRRLDLALDKTLTAKYALPANDPFSSAVLSFLYTDLVELFDYILSEYADKRILLSHNAIKTLFDNITDIACLKLDNHGILRVQLDLKRYVDYDTLSGISEYPTDFAHNLSTLENYVFYQLGKLLLSLTFFNRETGYKQEKRLNLKEEMSNLNLCPIYSNALYHLITCKDTDRKLSSLKTNEYYRSMMATSYIRRGMHIVSQDRYSIYPLHRAVTAGDVAHIRLLSRVCAGHRHQDTKSCFLLSLETLVEHAADLSFLHNLAVFVPKLYSLAIQSFHLYHLQHSVEHISAARFQLNIANNNLSCLIGSCSICWLLYSATRAMPWQPLLLHEDHGKHSMTTTADTLSKSLDYASLQMKFPSFMAISNAMEIALLLAPSECCINCARVNKGPDTNGGTSSFLYAYQAALECGIIQLNAAVAFYEGMVMLDIFEPKHLEYLTGYHFYASGRLPTSFKSRTASHRPMSRPLLRPLSKHRGITQQSTDDRGNGSSARKQNGTPSELAFAMIHQVPFYPVYVAECSGALDDKGQTALMRAAILDDLYTLHLLVHIDGQVRCQNLCGLTASMFSAIYDHPRALNITIPFECNMTDADGWVALTHAARWVSYDSVLVVSPHEALKFGNQALNILALEEAADLENIDELGEVHMERPQTRSGVSGGTRGGTSYQSLRGLIKFEIQKYMVVMNDDQMQLSDSYGASDDSAGDLGIEIKE
ncbi:Hypothetical protein GLP15_3968 [Giardia lamblia P15]|uniref:Ankyrin repeat protein n=1 Tax=Giardia intestinalis (strain P15) TaxID=658858 RepID=E1F9G2_GIAIA|nr:Hypothetical protein GLP15_3968 [Giardia lamblia P15]